MKLKIASMEKLPYSRAASVAQAKPQIRAGNVSKKAAIRLHPSFIFNFSPVSLSSIDKD